jgi:uncharacterized protein (DUF2384 family)
MKAELKARAAVAAIERVRDRYDFSYEDVARTLGADRKTLYRWRAEEFGPSEMYRDRVEMLNVLLHLLDETFETETAAGAWLHSAVPLLGGRSPIALLLEGQIDDVVGVLASLQSGAVV